MYESAVMGCTFHSQILLVLAEHTVESERPIGKTFDATEQERASNEMITVPSEAMQTTEQETTGSDKTTPAASDEAMQGCPHDHSDCTMYIEETNRGYFKEGQKLFNVICPLCNKICKPEGIFGVFYCKGVDDEGVDWLHACFTWKVLWEKLVE